MSPARTRPAGPYLDTPTVVRAAADLADERGWSQLTLSRVAEAVDRHVSSLYTHVDGLGALRRQVALLALDELADEVWRAALGRSGRDALMAIATVEREFSRDHPGRIAALNAYTGVSDPDVSARGARLAEPIRATLAGFGLDAERVAVAHQVFSAAVRGLVTTEVHTATGRAAGDEVITQTVDLFVTALESGAWPRPT